MQSKVTFQTAYIISQPLCFTKQLNYNKLFHTKSSTKTPVNETHNKTTRTIKETILKLIILFDETQG